jgi:ADP-ribose pyrophosphatase YjhB (NUDIX family)
MDESCGFAWWEERYCAMVFSRNVTDKKSDKEDESDKAVAIRETSEEIGLDLTSPHALFVGNLPERIVSTSFGQVPIMVLCPFVWLWDGPDIPPFKLQPTEVASTHWVPLRVLLSPSARTYEYVDVSDRFAHRGSTVLKTMIRSILGKMRFSAIRLTPSESLYCSSTAEFFSPPEGNSQASTKGSLTSRFYNWHLGDHAGASGNTRPLLLWGLTLGMLADFLDQLPPHNAVQLWSYPTFTSIDVRFIIDILTIPLKQRNRERLRKSGMKNETAIDSETEAVSGDNPWFIGGLSKGMEASKKGKNATRSYAVGILLEDYYNMARKGVWISAGMRFMATIGFVLYIIKRYRQQAGH